MAAPVRIPIAVFLTSFSPGGTERQMIELVRRLDRSRFAVHLACFHRAGEWQARAEELAESVGEFPVPSFHTAATVRHAGAFARWCRQREIVVLQTCDLYANTFGLPAAALAGVPVRIASRRELNPDKSAVHIAAQRFAYGFADHVVANSEAALARLRQEGIRTKRASVIRNGVDLEEFCPADRADGIRHVVTVARFRPEKGLDTLLDAARLVLRRAPDLDFTLVGDGPLAHPLRQRADAAGLGARVRFLGHCDAVAEVLRASDLFVLPSRSEAFPNAVIEAMATGLPIVATRVGGIPELIQHGSSGILVAPERPEELAKAIVDLASRPGYARALGRKARADAATFSFERMVGRFQDLYLGEAARKHAGRRTLDRDSRSQPVIP